jgi:hypothetical protein
MRMLRMSGLDRLAVAALLDRYQLELRMHADGAAIPGSYWGESEAGLVGAVLHARSDTPLHSVLHEAAHFICMTPERRSGLHTDAGGDDAEECAVCYLQLLMARELSQCGFARACDDMDEWGYSFRLGAARAWFEQDAEDARSWLLAEGIIDQQQRLTGTCRP